MSQLVIDLSLLSILDQAHGPTELIDSNGRSIGTFTPAPHLEEDWDMEEADRVLREEGHLGVTTEELMAHLRALEKQ